MTYFGFLLRFLAIPIVLLLGASLLRPPAWAPGRGRAFWLALAAQVALAVLYTTPWDNHLVASGVWSYNPQQVSGLLLGYVPVEEYVFFVLEALLVGLCWRALYARLAPAAHHRDLPAVRVAACLAGALIWLAAVWCLLTGWQPGTYLGLILAWALPPVILQLAFGADILWHYRRPLSVLIVAVGLYLSAADALAIERGIWTIDPAQSTGLLIGGLPVEEALFFFATVVLLAFGMTLSLAPESRSRLAGLRLRRRNPGEGRRLTQG